MLKGPPHGEIEKAERWAVMEWIVVGKRVWLVAGLLAGMALSTAVLIVYAEGVSHLNHKELGKLLTTQGEIQRPYGPIFQRVPEPAER